MDRHALLAETEALKHYDLSIFGHLFDLLKIYLHIKVHKYILRIYVGGFHHQNDGFPKNVMTVSYDRTVGT